MFDNLQNQNNNQSAAGQEKPKKIAPGEDINQRIKMLEAKGKTRRVKSKIYYVVGIVFLFITGGVLAGYIYWPEINGYFGFKSDEILYKGVACPMDDKICPNGSTVVRVPPDCEFTQCIEAPKVNGGNGEKTDNSNQILSTFKFTNQDETGDEEQADLDSDNDGLSDEEEEEYGTDPRNPDSDGDGYLDGDEVKNGYNPNKEGKIE